MGYASKIYVDGQVKKTDKEILDDMDFTVVENYVRKKKLLRIKRKIETK
jgi:hypothetical protein